MSITTYPCLVLNRKRSGGVDYWSCELRFDEHDAEQRDVDGSLEKALEVCAEKWGLKNVRPTMDSEHLQEFSHGQKFYLFDWDE